mmetsp:Transcript_30283/g.66421  ORF Transcript_30283/g.66421 Transcript_30283/m.66421 type:complete len:136 (-) Transcript_30283:802-1209(-)
MRAVEALRVGVVTVAGWEAESDSSFGFGCGDVGSSAKSRVPFHFGTERWRGVPAAGEKGNGDGDGDDGDAAMWTPLFGCCHDLNLIPSRLSALAALSGDALPTKPSAPRTRSNPCVEASNGTVGWANRVSGADST